MSRDYDLAHLHPVVRDKVVSLTKKFEQESLPFRLCEGFRSPERQHHLFGQSRTRPGPRVTNADAWSSFHQYGVACDFVLFIDGKWSWNDKGKYKKYWTRLHVLAKEVGLKPLSWELPHLQLESISLNELKQGKYPAGGDESWADNLSDAISNWTLSPAPPMPSGGFQRPPLPDTATEDSPSLSSSISSISSQYRVTARNGLYMRAGPSTHFNVVSTLAANQLLQVTHKRDDWYQVDLEGDGLADGYCHSGYLVAND